MSIFETSHKRYDPLTDEWIVVSPHRLKRPWQGKVEQSLPDTRPTYHPHCYLCPGNLRAGGIQTPAYTNTYVFENDFPALLNIKGPAKINKGSLLKAHAENGLCRVICYSPRHDLTLAQLDVSALKNVIDTWVEQTAELTADPKINHIQIFENKGAIMGCSNPHPHGQIWAQESIPTEPMKEERTQRAYFEKHGKTLLEDYLALEFQEADARIICKNNTWVCLVPFWAKWPFEVMLLPLRPVATLPALTDEERTGLADIISRITVRYDNLFNVSFPYTMGIHQAFINKTEQPHWHLHFHFYPPLLRSATVRKFMVGYEMLAEPQRDITPEQAAARLRELSEVHYTKQAQKKK